VGESHCGRETGQGIEWFLRNKAVMEEFLSKPRQNSSHCTVQASLTVLKEESQVEMETVGSAANTKKKKWSQNGAWSPGHTILPSPPCSYSYVFTVS
jgi:hypothetical protein